MYFLCVIHKKERKSSFLLHLLTNDGKKVTTQVSFPEN